MRIKVGDLDAVKADKPTPEAGLTAVLKLFLKKVYNVRKFGEPTWRRLVQAVQDPNGGDNPSLAEAISKEHRGLSVTYCVAGADTIFSLVRTDN